MNAEPETYTLMFKIDRENEIYTLVIAEQGRTGVPLLVNCIEDETVLDIYEHLIGRPIEMEDY